jgi:DNA-binding NarL/FixJ family response regulator
MSERLTNRECEVLTHICRGLSNEEIARELNVTVKTVEYHVTHILRKLGVRSRTEAVIATLEQGLLGPAHLEGHTRSEDSEN